MNEESTHRTVQWPRLLPVMLAAPVLLAYANTFGNPFLFDDYVVLVRNPELRRLGPVVLVDRFVTDLTFRLNFAADGLNVAGYHLVNVTIHLLCALVLYGLVRRALPATAPARPWIAFAAASIWAVHPLQTESVTYISQRYEALMALFYLLTLYTFQRGAQSGRPFGWYGLSVAACLVGMGSKAVMVTAPLAVLMFDFVFVAHGRVRELVRRRWLYYLLLFASWVFLAVLIRRMVIAAEVSGYETVAPLSSWEYLASQFGVILTYVRLAFVPWPLCLDRARDLADHWVEIALPGAVLAVMGAACLWGFLRRRAWGWLGLFFFLGLAPTSSIMPVADLAVEHRMYLPLVAIVCLVVVGYVRLRRKVRCRGAQPFPGRVDGLLLLTVLAILLLLTVQRNQVYGSAERMLRDVKAKAPHNYRQHLALTQVLLNNLRCEESLSEAHALASKTAAAKQLSASGEVKIAARNPWKYHSLAYNAIGRAHLCLGQHDAAVGAFAEALRIDPVYRVGRYNLAVALYEAGRREESLEMCRVVIRRFPDYASAYQLAGTILTEHGRFEEAVLHLETAFELRPLNLSTRLELAWLLAAAPVADVRNGERAAALASEIVDATERMSYRALDVLAAACAESGDFDRAVGLQTEALRAAESRGGAVVTDPAEVEALPAADAAQLEAMQQRLALYRKGLPFRLPGGVND